MTRMVSPSALIVAGAPFGKLMSSCGAPTHMTNDNEPRHRRTTTAALLLTDVVDSTKLSEQLGDTAMADLWAKQPVVLRADTSGARRRTAQGDLWQLGGLFVVCPGGRVTFEHVSTTAGDHPALDQILAALDVAAPTAAAS